MPFATLTAQVRYRVFSEMQVIQAKESTVHLCYESSQVSHDEVEEARACELGHLIQVLPLKHAVLFLCLD